MTLFSRSPGEIYSRLVFVALQLFRTGQLTDELAGFVNQDREVLWADPILPVLVFDG